jgi:hypothetical protein
MPRRGFVSILLVLAIVPIVTLTPSTPEAQSQALTTITSYITTPTTVTSTRKVTVETIKTSTFTSSYSATSSLTPPKKLFSETILLKAPGPNYSCHVDDRAFSAKKGQVVSVDLESNNEFSMYLMTEKDYKAWDKTKECSPGEVSDFTGAFGITSYNEQLVMGNDGWYRFVFLNYGYDMAVIKFKAEVVGAAYETTSVVTSHVVSLQYSTDTMTLTTIATGTVVRTEQVGFPLARNGLLVVAAVLLVVILVVVGIALRRQREKAVAIAKKQKIVLEAAVTEEAPPEPQPKEIAAAEPKVPVRFCMNCGAEMVADALYCPICAAGTLAFVSDKTLGLERLEHAAIQASVIVRHMEVKIGEDATIELQMINAGKKPATLVKIENVVPAGFELVSGPAPYRLVGDDLHLKGKRLDAMKTEEIELVLRPKRRGSFILKPRIFYLDENGNYRYHEPDPVTIKVKEMGLRGWVTGPE